MKPTDEDDRNRTFAYLLLRAMLGVNMAVHGLSRILAGPTAFADSLVHGFQNTPLPAMLVRPFALSLPLGEAVVGLLILLGLFRLPALLAGGTMLVALTFGSTLRQDWQSAGLQLIYAIVYAAVLAFLRYDRFALDLVFWRTPRKQSGSELRRDLP